MDLIEEKKKLMASYLNVDLVLLVVFWGFFLVVQDCSLNQCFCVGRWKCG